MYEKQIIIMTFPETLILHNNNTDRISHRIWDKIITEEKEHKNSFQSSTTTIFDSCGTLPTLPADVVQEIMTFMPISITTLSKISKLVDRYHRMYILINGRGGEGLHLPRSLHPNLALWLRENQQPKLRFSQPDFNKQIKECAHQVLFRQLNFCGDIETQLAIFVNYLINKC